MTDESSATYRQGFNAGFRAAADYLESDDLWDIKYPNAMTAIRAEADRREGK